MKDRGKIVKTKSGLIGKAPAHIAPVNGKVVVKVVKDSKEINMLCRPEDLQIMGYYD